ncbi:diadenylate cyclase [Bacillus velezensis]|nr:diadenylate cyclase [Bacillus velezensis]
MIERADPLDGMIQRDQPACRDQCALIESIFYPGNPLHDGAVLVRENRVVSATKCFRSQQNMSISNTGRATGPQWDFRRD